MVLGRRVYNNCMACHQRDGLGVAGNYPPLAGSEWVEGSPTVLAALLLGGLEGTIQVSGETYNQVMPRWSHLSDEQIAAVLTYIRGSWENRSGPVAPELVAAVREQTADRARPWTAPELTEFAASFSFAVVEPSGEESAAGQAPVGEGQPAATAPAGEVPPA
jgi:cytochrome c